MKQTAGPLFWDISYERMVEEWQWDRGEQRDSEGFFLPKSPALMAESFQNHLISNTADLILQDNFPLMRKNGFYFLL